MPGFGAAVRLLTWDTPATGRGVMATALRDGRLAVVGALGGPDSELDSLRVIWLQRR